ncbi:hypothetical protein WG66_003695 [Moniliophthora roreri]|uniref:DUF3291 domain-containing protein n=1 Tax=Moniliophthora roreri TaxID=221103 RepID=A0A0W0F411_MONRR|nr:hypothetical protein WG66_003695 [Moniliophthora roreri]
MQPSDLLKPFLLTIFTLVNASCSEFDLTQKFTVQSFSLRNAFEGTFNEVKASMSLLKFNAEGNLTHSFVGRHDSDHGSITQLFLWNEPFTDFYHLNTTFIPFSSNPINEITSVLMTDRIALWYALHAPVTRVLVVLGREGVDYIKLTEEWIEVLKDAKGHWGSAFGTPIHGFDDGEPARRFVMVSAWQSIEAYDTFIAGIDSETRALYEQWKGGFVNPMPEWMQLYQAP